MSNINIRRKYTKTFEQRKLASDILFTHSNKKFLTKQLPLGHKEVTPKKSFDLSNLQKFTLFQKSNSTKSLKENNVDLDLILPPSTPVHEPSYFEHKKTSYKMIDTKFREKMKFRQR